MSRHLALPVQADIALGDFATEAGEVIVDARMRCRIYGDPELGSANGWILVFHALTGSHDVHQWWGPLLGDGLALDTTSHPVIAANLLGSCYGSSGPLPGIPFPALSPGDLAGAHNLLLQALDISRVALATGGSLGGMVALHWARLAAVPTDRVVVFAAPGVMGAQAIAWNAAQRMAIESDPAWSGEIHGAAKATAGLAAARAIAMITYRSSAEFSDRFERKTGGAEHHFQVEQYLRRQGEKLIERFDSLSYYTLTQIMDRHDLGDLVDTAHAMKQRVGTVIGVGIDSDMLFLQAKSLTGSTHSPAWACRPDTRRSPHEAGTMAS